MTKVFIDGAEGTTGLRIAQRLEGRGDVRLIPIPESVRKDPSERKKRYEEADIAILCLPDQAAREAAELAKGAGVRIIDASTAHRTEPGWAYGFAELSAAHRQAIAAGERVAVPGCHACGFISLVYPMVKSGMMPADYPVVCHSVTGYSGGGRKMIAQYEADGRDAALDSPRQYGLSQQHKHLKEMTAIPGLAYPPAFSPIVSDYYSGMVVTVPVFPRLLNGTVNRAEILEMFADHYAGQRLVRVLRDSFDGEMLAGNALSGRDDMEIAVLGNDERVLLVSRFDNLGKGASGSAVQCLNLMTGMDETTGLVL
ncbi:MAG: N-acetyl-gamma-glutamyl-phosphate reductase [Clostridia bacterium]|nr:N-acetyl-gamma-glutamyl-phosphate reductase [Clostridia bacterium]